MLQISHFLGLTIPILFASLAQSTDRDVSLNLIHKQSLKLNRGNDDYDKLSVRDEDRIFKIRPWEVERKSFVWKRSSEESKRHLKQNKLKEMEKEEEEKGKEIERTSDDDSLHLQFEMDFDD